MKDGKKTDIDFIGVGFAKCGTTYIAKLLQEHPDIFIPDSKELNFFSPVNKYYTNSEKLLTDQYKSIGINSYTNFFGEAKKNQFIGEWSTHYNNKLSAIRIKKHFPKTKILFSIRNPIKRSFSSYNYFDNKNSSFLKSFKKNKDIYTIENSYYETIKIYYELFGKKNVKIIIFEDFIKNPKKGIKYIYKFLGVKNDFIPYSINKTINKTKVPKNKFLYNFTVKVLLFSEKVKKNKIGSKIITILKSFGINKILDIFLKRTEKKYGNVIPKNIKDDFLNFHIKDTKKLSKLIGKDLNKIWNIK